MRIVPVSYTHLNFNLLIDLLIKRKVLSHISELNLHDMIEAVSYTHLA